MEDYRLKALAIIAALTAFASAPLFATGDWDETEPPTLDTYLDRLPGKSLGQIFEETAPKPSKVNQPNVAKALKTIAADARTKPADKLIAEINSLIGALRADRARAQAAPADKPPLPARDLNLLHDVRDALAAAGTEAADYIAWRIDSDLLIQPEPKPDGEPSEMPKTLTADLEKRTGDAKGPMRAQWLYLRGAVAFHHGHKAEALRWFDKVLEEAPQHPRAEAALFMRGRCLLSESRKSADEGYGRDGSIKDSSLHGQARDCFLKYINDYPQGRFIADARGWLGGVAWDEEDYLKALGWYIQQAETPDHPEVLKSSVLMIEKALRRLAGAENPDAAFALVARHPKVAMAMLYLVLDSPDAAHRAYQWLDSANGDEKIRQWRNSLLPRLAAAVAEQKEAYSGDAWQPRYLAILVHAASNTGNQEEALRIAGTAPNPEVNDDLLFAKAVAVQRSGKVADAIPLFRLFLKKFEASPLAPGGRIRLALALRDHHEAGMAVEELKKLHKENQEGTAGILYESLIPADYELAFTAPAVYDDISDAESDQVNQLIGTLLTFAPLSELEAGLKASGIEPGFAADLRAIIARRALFHEDFKTAREMMTPAQYALDGANLERLTQAANKPSKNKALEKAEGEMRIADAWAAVTQKPLLSDPALTQSELDRRTNARVLGIADPDDELESSYPLVHAWHWWLRAAQTAPGSPVSAAARLKVLEAMAALAKTDYGLTRAVEDDWSHASREIYDRLQAECPKSKEAKQAAYWSFVLPTPDRDYRDSANPLGFHYDPGDILKPFERAEAGYRVSDFNVFRKTDDDGWQNGGSDTVWGPIAGRIDELRSTTKDVSALAKEVNDLKKLVLENYGLVAQTACLNFIEDLALFLSEPKVTKEVAASYINLRLDVLARSAWGASPVNPSVNGIPEGADADAIVRGRIADAIKDPAMQPVRDYLEFLDAAMIANHQIHVPCAGQNYKDEPNTYPTRDYPVLEQMMRAFLKRYPHSKKREAARLLLARAVYKQSWPVEGHQREPLNPKRVAAELDAYDKEFPNGRYAADIRNMRASLFWRTGQWKPALDMTLRQVGEDKPDLKIDGALRLAGLFAELATAEHRPEMMAAIRSNPAAVSQLEDYLAKAPNYSNHPLRFLGGYLEDQIGFKLPPPDEKN